MKDKYYQPKIEEFCVGFEYENHEHFGKDFGKYKKYVVDSRESFFQLNGLLATGSIRVKYLDKDDIESLGFSEVMVDQYYIEAWGKYITLLIDSDYYIQLIIGEDGIIDYLFQGTVKNKSEFKKLLTMLGIKYDKDN